MLLEALLLRIVILAVPCGLVAVTENQMSEGFGINQTVSGTTAVTGNGSELVNNQYIVMLQNNTTQGDMLLLIKEIHDMDAQITGVYGELFNGFSFKTQDNQTAEEIVGFLEASPQVQSVTADRTVSIQPQ